MKSVVDPAANGNGNGADQSDRSLVETIAARRSAITVYQLADQLSLSRRAVYDMVKDGRLPHMRIGNNVRFDPKAIAHWLEKQVVTSI